MSADPTTVIAALGLEPAYSAREASALLGRSYSWLDQRLRAGEFTLPDGTQVTPLRTPGGYRRFTPAMLEGIAACSYRCGWYSMDELEFAIGELLTAAYRETGEAKFRPIRSQSADSDCIGNEQAMA